MIYGIGSDIVNIKRLEKSEEFLLRFIRRCMTESEQQTMQRRGLADMQTRIAYVAKRFAAKEAVVKALGTGFRDGLYLSDVEVINDNYGKPYVILHGNTLKYVKDTFGNREIKIHLSLSDDYPFAQAMAVLEV